MQRLEVSGALRPIYGSLGVKRLNIVKLLVSEICVLVGRLQYNTSKCIHAVNDDEKYSVEYQK